MLPDTTTKEPVSTSTILQAELSYMANKLNVPVQEIRRAVAAVGEDPKMIQAFLKQFGIRG